MPRAEIEIAIIRHPETVANVERRYVGRTESAITEVGLEQIRALTAFAGAWRPSVVFTSPRVRTLQTATAIAEGGTPLTVLDDLQEIDFGRAEGLTWDELAALGMTIDYRRGGAETEAAGIESPRTDTVAPGGESWNAFERRVRHAADVCEAGGSRVAIVTHGGVFRTLLAHWLGIPMEAAWRFSVPNAAVATLTVTNGDGVLTSLLSGR